MSPSDSQIKSEAYAGCDGLFKLWLEAMGNFQSAVLKSNVRYSRFCEDFINSHLFHDATDSASRNGHMVNLGRIRSLLEQREDLVRRYSAGDLSQSSFDSCMEELMLINKGIVRDVVRDFDCHLSPKTIHMITMAANDIPLFKKQVSEEEMALLFNDCVSFERNLVADNNGVLSYFFSQLNYYSIISNRYQSVIESHHLILSSSAKKCLTAHLLAASLRQWEDKEKPVKLKVDRWLPLIKETVFTAE